MRILYNKEIISELLKDFATLTRISVTFVDSETNSVCGFRSTEDFCDAYQSIGSNREYCTRSDKRLLERCRQSGQYEYHICHAGLYDAAMPVVKQGVTVGYIMVGRLRTRHGGADAACGFKGELKALYEKIPVFDDVQLSSLKNLLANILFTNAIELENTDIAENIRDYMEENLSEELTAAVLCKRFFLSRNNLYRIFRESFGCTPAAYITERRLEKAKTLLAETKEPVYSVCERVGIHNYTYFCNLFRNKTGVTPTGYRKDRQGGSR